jgi:hypothetical protein
MIRMQDPRPRLLALPLVGPALRWLCAAEVAAVRASLEERIAQAEGDAASYRRQVVQLAEAHEVDLDYFRGRIDALKWQLRQAKGGNGDA